MIRHKSKITEIFNKLCKQHNYDFIIEGPDKGYFIDRNGIKYKFNYGTIDINDPKYIKIADSKEKSSLLMGAAGIPMPREMVIKKIKEAGNQDLSQKISNFAKQVGFPLITKPLKGRQGNNLIKIESEDEIINASERIINVGYDIIVQEYLDFDEIRVVMLDEEILQAYKKLQPYVAGDGIKNISNLINDKNKYFAINNRNTIIDIYDSQIQLIISKLGYSNNSILPKDKKLYLSFGRNLSKGGEYEFIDIKIGSKIYEVIKNVFKISKLRLVGFDLFVKKDLNHIKDEQDIVLIEYNASPDMENNFYYNTYYYKNLLMNYIKIFLAMIKK